MSDHVNADTFVRAETDRMFADIQRDAGGVNVFRHNRGPAEIEHQSVIRLNRDTLYSFAVVDLSGGARLTIPDAGERYLSVMVLDNDHFVRAVLHDAGEHDLAALAPDAEYVLVAARTLVNSDDPDDIAEVTALQDRFVLDAESSRPFEPGDWDAASLDATRDALLTLARGLRAFDRTFGDRDEVDPVRHLIGTAAGWGGLPLWEASYVGVDPQLPVGHYELTMRDVPVDGFWSVSVYNARGYFEPNAEGRYSVNSVTGTRDEDGSITVRFTPPGEVEGPNDIPVPEGWNFLVRLYRPRAEILEGRWEVPDLVREAEEDQGAGVAPAAEPEAEEVPAEDASAEDASAGDRDAEAAPPEDVSAEGDSPEARAD
jgi:hypothetical protein